MRLVRITTLLAGLAFVGCGRKSDPVPASDPVAAPDFERTLDPERHRFQQQRLSIRFPKGFARIPPDNPNAIVLVTNPARTANINIRVPPARPADSVDVIHREIRDSLEKQAENAVPGGEGEFTVGGLRCRWLSLTHGPPQKRVDAVVYLVKRETDVVMVFGTTSHGELTTHRAAFDDSVRSIQFE
jgi:hypothetical protein